MQFAADFTAIDFETANRRRDSACQLAAVVVRGGRIVDSAMWMIRPDPLYFAPGNIGIHGITPSKVSRERVFGDLWPEIAAKLDDDCLVAHNVSFDIGVLMACLRQSGHPIPELSFTCTRAVARRTWPHRPRFGLKPLAEWLGIRFRHHDALEDSIACAKIMLAAGIDREAGSLPELEKSLAIRRGHAGDWGYRGPKSTSVRRPTSRRESNQASITRTAAPIGSPSPAAESPFLYPGQHRDPSQHRETSRERIGESTAGYSNRAASRSRSGGTSAAGGSSASAINVPMIDIQRLMIRAEFIRPLAGQRVVFTGRLGNLSREEAQRLAARLGGECQSAVDETTDLWVQGSAELSDHATSASSPSIRVVTEIEFLELVISPGSAW